MKVHCIPLTVIALLGTTSFGADLPAKAVGTLIELPGQAIGTARKVISYPFYEKPFFIDFIMTRTIEKISGVDENCFSIQIITEGTTTPDFTAFGKTIKKLSQLFLHGKNFVYDSKLRRDETYENTLKNLPISAQDKNRILSAWENLDQKLMTKYVQDFDIKDSKGKNQAGQVAIRIGTNSPMSRVWTALYNDVADFAEVVGITMPRVESQLHKMLVNKWTKGLAFTALVAGIGYYTYKNWDQIPSREQIGATTLAEVGPAIKSAGSTVIRDTSSVIKGAGSTTWSLGRRLKNLIFGSGTPTNTEASPAEPSTPPNIIQPTSTQEPTPLPQTLPTPGNVEIKASTPTPTSESPPIAPQIPAQALEMIQPPSSGSNTGEIAPLPIQAPATTPLPPQAPPVTPPPLAEIPLQQPPATTKGNSGVNPDDFDVDI
jgi:hypothetical protein